MTMTLDVPTQQTEKWKGENLPTISPTLKGSERWLQSPRPTLQDMEAGEEYYDAIENGAPCSVEPITVPTVFIPRTSKNVTATETQPLLSILIPTVVTRKKTFDALMRMLNAQRNALPNPELVEIVTLLDNGELMVGAKRNKLLDMARGEYLCFIDDDDRIFGDYLEKIINALDTRPDSVGVSIYWSDDLFKAVRLLVRSLDFKWTHWLVKADNLTVGRPAHLNPTRSSIAKSERFSESVLAGEDSDWSARVAAKLKTHVDILEPIYHYDFRTAGTITQRPGAREAMQPALPPGHQRAYRDGKIVELDTKGNVVIHEQSKPN